MSQHKPRFWIGVASKNHVANGVELGIAQFCHGKSGPAKRPAKGDYVIYYSSKHQMEVDDEPYQVDMGNGFKPYRRDIHYLTAQHLDIKPLVATLPFIKNKNAWGAPFRYGFLEIDPESFDIIAKGMLGFNPLD